MNNQAVANVAAYHPAWQETLMTGPIFLGLCVLAVFVFLMFPRSGALWLLRHWGYGRMVEAGKITLWLAAGTAAFFGLVAFMHMDF